MNKDREKMIDFSPAVLDDLDLLLQVEKTCFEFNQLKRRSFIHLISHGKCSLVVARDIESRAVVGYGLLLFKKGSQSARLYSLAILPSCAGKGIGNSLLNFLEKIAFEKKCSQVKLEVHHGNKKAFFLYQKNGYRIVGERHDFYEDGSSAYCLLKEL